jgi:uncharacterized protein YuzE
MATLQLEEYLKLVPAVLHAPGSYLWSSYDAEADVLYINFKKPAQADDSDVTDDDIIIRYERGQIIGLTILHARDRLSKKRAAKKQRKHSAKRSGKQ